MLYLLHILISKFEMHLSKLHTQIQIHIVSFFFLDLRTLPTRTENPVALVRQDGEMGDVPTNPLHCDTS